MFIANAYAQSGPAADGGNVAFQLFFLALMFGIFYFIAIRPQRKRQKEHTEMVSSLKKGDEVITAGGMLGKITGLDENYASLQVANNVEIKFQRSNIAAVLPKGTIKSVGAE